MTGGRVLTRGEIGVGPVDQKCVLMTRGLGVIETRSCKRCIAERLLARPLNLPFRREDALEKTYFLARRRDDLFAGYSRLRTTDGLCFRSRYHPFSIGVIDRVAFPTCIAHRWHLPFLQW